MINSGDAQQVYIADALDEIASNGEGQDTDDFLADCAYEMSDAASDAGHMIRHGKQQDDQPSEGMGPADAPTLQDLLLLVDVEASQDEIKTWTAEQRQGAEHWAGALHLRASDNDDVVVPTCPFVVPPDCTANQLADRTNRGADGYNWGVYVDRHPAVERIGNIHLPSFFDMEMAARFAYQKFKARLRAADDWSVE
jgi:hypothetical protein